MKQIFLLLTMLSMALFTNAQSLDLSQPLPLDTSIKKGVLPNGITYYLHSTDVTKDVASYYIIQNVGSILENDNQQGLAHFLEHMAFNGTETFPGKSFLNKVQEHGLIFGKGINAYTSFDETVYNIDNLPTTPELTEAGLQILHDWSNYLLLTDEEIDAERGVIKEEWRTRQSGRMRVFKQTIGTMFGNSKYQYRMPIGLMSIVENFEYKALRDFYHDWYRTDLQAIAIVGDFDVSEMEAKIKKKFSSIPAVKTPPKRFNVKIEDNKELEFAIGMDKEVSTASIAFNIRHNKSLEDKTVADLKDDLLNSMITSILNNRFREMAQQNEAPFIGVNANYSSLTRLHNNFSLQITPKPNMQQKAFKLAMNELNRAVKFGFTKSEINIAKADFSGYYENQIAKLDDRSSGQIIQAVKTNYLENAHLTDIVKEYELVKILFNELTQADLLKRIQTIYTQKNRNVIITGVEGNENLTKAQVKELITASENDASLQAYEEGEEVQSLMTGVELIPGKIVSENKNDALGFTTYTLSNGIEVHYKFVDKNKNVVTLEAISDGGESLLNTEDLPSAQMINNVAQMSGLGVFSATDLPKVLAGKTASTSFYIDNIKESVSGSSSTKDIETMIQMVNLRFTKPRFDETGYNFLMQNIDNYLIRKSQDLSSKMQDSITTTLYGYNHPVKRIFNKDFVADISLDKVKAIYNDRFSNPADFKFFIVGDVTQENLKPLLEKYIASLPTSKVKENWKDNSAEWSLKNTDKDVFIPMEDEKGSVNIAIKKEMPFNLKNQFLLDVLGNILQLRYTESLREQEGGTYGASVNGKLFKEPKSYAYISVKFDCNPDLVEKLITLVYKELEAIKNGTIRQEDLDKTLTNFLKERKDSKNFNNYDLTAMKNYVLEGYNMELSENFEAKVNSITKKDIQGITNRILTDYKSYEIIFKPLSE